MDDRMAVSWPVGVVLVGAVVAFAAWAQVSKSRVVEVLLQGFLGDQPRPLSRKPAELTGARQ